MSDNAIILGAGFSAVAGIPVMSNFVEVMQKIAWTKKSPNGQPLQGGDPDTFDQALSIMSELDAYHGRAAFDDRNIEDLLSMLSFNVVGGSESEREKLRAFNRAIARTIDLTCNVRHPGPPRGNQWSYSEEGPEEYRSFWMALLKWRRETGDLPTIVTLNYDLVLERSLFQVLVNKRFKSSSTWPFRKFQVDYHYDLVPPQSFALEQCRYGTMGEAEFGSVVKQTSDSPECRINLLKLHGSLNFPEKLIDDPTSYNLVEPLDTPYILPPISNKFVSDRAESIWKAALEQLREARNLVIVGYSLPSTDVYMQFFLKAALGPNTKLNQIIIIDPAAHTGRQSAIVQRYESCFASQWKGRLQINANGCAEAGTFMHTLAERPGRFLFAR